MTGVRVQCFLVGYFISSDGALSSAEKWRIELFFLPVEIVVYSDCAVGYLENVLA